MFWKKSGASVQLQSNYSLTRFTNPKDHVLCHSLKIQWKWFHYSLIIEQKLLIKFTLPWVFFSQNSLGTSQGNILLPFQYNLAILRSGQSFWTLRFFVIIFRVTTYLAIKIKVRNLNTITFSTMRWHRPVYILLTKPCKEWQQKTMLTSVLESLYYQYVKETVVKFSLIERTFFQVKHIIINYKLYEVETFLRS